MENNKGYWKYVNALLYLMLVILLVMHNLFSFNKSVGDSMEPTFYSGNQSVYQTYITDVKRDDIISISTKGIGNNINWNNYRFIAKRVIGIPGDIVVIYKNNLYINDVLQKEEYIKEPMKGNRNEITILGDNEFYVMGDNRNVSIDSRDFGPITSNDIFSLHIKTIKNK